MRTLLQMSLVVGVMLVVMAATVAAQPGAKGAPGGLPAVQARVAALEAELATVVEELAVLRGTAGATAADVVALAARVTAIEAALAEIGGGHGGGLTSYDELGDLPCTTSWGSPGTVALVGVLRSPACGVRSANGRFIDFGLAILDTATNLMWEKKVEGAGLHGVDAAFTWCEATGSTSGVCAGNTASWIGAVNQSGLAGFSNWRVPTIAEMQTLVDATVGLPRIDPVFAPVIPSGGASATPGVYWTADESPTQPHAARYFNVTFGGPGTTDKVVPFTVRAVRTAY